MRAASEQTSVPGCITSTSERQEAPRLAPPHQRPITAQQRQRPRQRDRQRPRRSTPPRLRRLVRVLGDPPGRRHGDGTVEPDRGLRRLRRGHPGLLAGGRVAEVPRAQGDDQGGLCLRHGNRQHGRHDAVHRQGHPRGALVLGISL